MQQDQPSTSVPTEPLPTQEELKPALNENPRANENTDESPAAEGAATGTEVTDGEAG